jgi:cobalt-zinc-cadmium efflux system membrane fusion protein
VVFRPDGAADRAATGKVTWISTAVGDQTRTVRVRAAVPNPDGRLLARSFGQAEISIRHTPAAIAIPNEAVQWEGCCYVAFVRQSDTIFQTRKLRIGASANGFTEVIIGVLPGEVVVADGSYVLKSEILKANLGATCGDD